VKTSSFKALQTYAWALVVYLIGVILFGAWVRITHSGAGCGEHWPTCHGQIVPLEPTIETMIEYTHRLTSGLCGIFAIVLLGWSSRVSGWSRITRGALIVLALTIFEGAIGAGLVLGELVNNDDSVARAVVISLHLVNTLVLMGAASLTAWWAGGRPAFSIRKPSPLRLWLLACIGLVILTAMTGAVTALGDTLFPVDPTLGGGLLGRISDDLTSANHFLVRLRIVHPIIAVLTASAVFVMSSIVRYQSVDDLTRRLSTMLAVVVGIQTVLGVSNIALQAPGWMQLLHLATAQVLWIILVLVFAHVQADSDTGRAGGVAL
jgi:cytochrome c oxidase assembly protein subunit 15